MLCSLCSEPADLLIVRAPGAWPREICRACALFIKHMGTDASFESAERYSELTALSAVDDLLQSAG